MVDALSMLATSLEATSHIKALTADPANESIFADAQLFCFQQRLCGSREVAQRVNKIMTDLSNCPHPTATQDKATLVQTLCPGTIYHGCLTLHKQRVIDQDANLQAAQHQLAEKAAHAAAAEAAKALHSKQSCLNPPCPKARILATDHNGSPTVRVSAEGTPTLYHDYCGRSCATAHEVHKQVQQFLAANNSRASHSFQPAAPSSMFPNPSDVHASSSGTPPSFGLQPPRLSASQSAVAGLTAWLGMPGLFSLETGGSIVAKLVSAGNDSDGPVATFQGADGTVLEGIRTARANAALIELRTALNTPDSADGDLELARYFEAAVKDYPQYPHEVSNRNRTGLDHRTTLLDPPCAAASPTTSF